MPEPPPEPTSDLAQRLTEAEAKIATLEATLAALDAATTERLNDQMARLVRTVLGLLEGRGGSSNVADRARSRELRGM